MTRNEIEHMWKVASNNPNHDTNWHDPVVIAFAKLVAQHTLSNIDPSKFMSYQEVFEAGCLAEREACAKLCFEMWDKWMDADPSERHNLPRDAEDCAHAIRARGQA